MQTARHFSHMRIALLDPASFVLPYVVFLARGLASYGHRVEIFCSHTKYNESLLKELCDEALEMPVQSHLYRVSQTAATSRWSGLVAYLSMLIAVFGQRRSFDAINIQFGIFLPFDILFMILLSGRIDYTIHDDVPHGFRRRWHLPTLIRANLARRLIFTSEAVRDRFFIRYPMSRLKARAHLLQHGLLGATLRTPSPQESAHSAAPVVTFFGTVKPYKGVEQLVSAATLLVGTRVEIHGQWDKSLKDLKTQAETQGCVVKDEFLPAPALDNLLSEHRIFVLPYRDASQSGVLYLLLNYGRPFVSTDSGDLGAFLRREGLPELIFPLDNAAKLARCIEIACADYERIALRLQSIRRSYEWAEVIKTAGLYGI